MHSETVIYKKIPVTMNTETLIDQLLPLLREHVILRERIQFHRDTYMAGREKEIPGFKRQRLHGTQEELAIMGRWHREFEKLPEVRQAHKALGAFMDRIVETYEQFLPGSLPELQIAIREDPKRTSGFWTLKTLQRLCAEHKVTMATQQDRALYQLAQAS